MRLLPEVHPAVHVTAGFILILLLQNLHGSLLALAVGVFCAAAFAMARSAWWVMVRRLRYMLLVLIGLFAWQTPGSLLVPAWGAFSPTQEGAAFGLEGAGRILLAVAVVSLMWRYLSRRDWVEGFYGMVVSFECVGLNAERFALRLMLVLNAVESSNRSITGWREGLFSDELPPEPNLEVDLHMPQWYDYALMTGLLILSGFLLL